jgi:hypothetical protein
MYFVSAWSTAVILGIRIRNSLSESPPRFALALQRSSMCNSLFPVGVLEGYRYMIHVPRVSSFHRGRILWVMRRLISSRARGKCPLSFRTVS